MAPPTPLFPTSPASAMGPRSLDVKEKDKGVNVQVLLRCRPFNDDELRSNAPQVISCYDQRREVSVNLNIAAKQIDRTFTFDKVFGPQAQQKDLYEQAIVPIVNEVLEGFNCTIFAYGQTGTGKTYTMEGSGRKTKNGEMPADAGVIPRAVQQIVDTLEAQNAEYSMKVTFLELYNEEITDLLAPEDIARSLEDRQKKPLALMEDGKGGVLVRGLEEEVVYSASEIYNLLERGSAKRRTAETLLNKQSSRSHSIFSITIHIKEATLDGEELIKCGKLNLVDLAGSENISRSGARDGRAREAGEINKSLLTLGRVITALVEHLGHIPYRDSKLTRLLRDSLGGRTKTCIIATVSPSVHCLEETLSTLDYAHRAKNIKNKPEVNQKMMKSALIKDLYTEIEKLKGEVYAAREKNGVYLPRERFLQEEAEKKAMSERIEQMECEIEVKNKKLDDLQEALDSERRQFGDLSAKLETSQRKLQQTQESLIDAKEKIKQAQYIVKEKEFIIAKYQQSENALVEQAGMLQSQLESCVNDISGLHMKIERKDKVETENQHTVQTFHEDLGQQLKALHVCVTESIKHQQLHLQSMQEHIGIFRANKDEVTDILREKVSSLKEMFHSGLKQIHDLVHSHEKDSTSTFEKLNSTVSAHSIALEELILKSVSEAEAVLQDLQQAFVKQQENIASFICQRQEKAQQNIDAAREMSKKVVAFYEFQERSANDLQVYVAGSHKDLQQTLTELEKTYEELSHREERLLIEKIAEMVSTVTARKSEIVNSKISLLREASIKDSGHLAKDLTKIKETSSESQNQWQAYMTEAEKDFSLSSTDLVTQSGCLEDVLEHCTKTSIRARDAWRQTQESIQHFEKNNLLAVDLIVKEGVYGNGLLLSNLEELNGSVESDVQIGNNAVTEMIDQSVKTDNDSAATMLSTMASQAQALTDLQVCHGSGTDDIHSLADHCFKEEYTEDKPTKVTPVKRALDVASKAAIEALRAPGIEDLVQQFRDVHHPSPEKTAAGQRGGMVVKESKIPIFADSSLLKDNSRVPLGTVN